MIGWKFSKNILILCENQKSAILMKIRQNPQFLSFVIFVGENLNEHFCKLKKILRNFLADNFLPLRQFAIY